MIQRHVHGEMMVQSWDDDIERREKCKGEEKVDFNYFISIVNLLFLYFIDYVRFNRMSRYSTTSTQ